MRTEAIWALDLKFIRPSLSTVIHMFDSRNIKTFVANFVFTLRTAYIQCSNSTARTKRYVTLLLLSDNVYKIHEFSEKKSVNIYIRTSYQIPKRFCYNHLVNKYSIGI